MIGASARRRRVVTIVGGGVHAATLVDVLCDSASMLVANAAEHVEIRLVARDEGRLGVIATHAAHRLATARPDWSLSWTTNLAEGSANADAVVLLVRIGGSVARDHDERFAAELGLVGDEGVGVGALANAWRTVPELEAIGATLATVAPDAVVLNLVAPLGITTRVLGGSGLRCVGVCELPIVVGERLLGEVPVTRRSEVRSSLGFGGPNHLSWFWPTDPGVAGIVREAALAAGLVDEDTWQRFGGAPMPYYFRVLEPERGAALGVVGGVGRALELAELSRRALEQMAARPGSDVAALDERATPWFDRAVLPVLGAVFGANPYQGPLNVADSRGRVVETMVRLDAGAPTLSDLGHPPEPIAEFIEHWLRIDEVILAAALNRDRHLMAEALAQLPFDLSPQQRETLLRSILATREQVEA